MERSRTKEEIFNDMHREMRRWNPDVSESVERLDPVLKILMQLYAHQLERIDSRISKTWDIASSSLIRALCPESKRWPVPACTVMRCTPVDPVVIVDPHTRFYYREKREGAHTLFFSSLRDEKILAARVRHIFYSTDDTLIDLSPTDGDQRYAGSNKAPASGSTPGNMYVALDFDGNSSDFAGALVFLRGNVNALRQLRWGRWYPGANFGGFYDDSGFCPGLTGGIESLFQDGNGFTDWGGLRSSVDLFKNLEDNIAVLPENFALTWEVGPPEDDLLNQLSKYDIELETEDGRFYWIKIELPSGGDKSSLAEPFDMFFDAFIAVNKNELTLFKHTGGNRLLEIEIPENLDNVLEITSVADSNGREYIPSYQMRQNSDQRVYTLEERDGKMVLWFDFTSHLELSPDSITVTYATTVGIDANGVDAGKITDLYENHPGIDSAENVIASTGAIPAKTMEQVMIEVSARLRGRDRALNFSEIADWAMTFDPRIRKAACENGIQRTDRGVRRCIVIKVIVDTEKFHSEDERELLRLRLTDFLKSRSSVNTQYRVEIGAA